MIADLHTHTSCSDGSLTPTDLLARAQAAGVDLLAITDHDTLAAYDNVRIGRHGGLKLVSGIEFSTRWRRIGVHVVGLNFDTGDAQLKRAVRRQQDARDARALRIAERLEKLGFAGCLEGAQAQSDSAQLGRPHFAAHLVSIGAVRDVREAFRKYLGTGKAGDVRSGWGSLEEAVGWIRAAGGNAVLAHPAKYRLTRTRLNELTAAFTDAGGDALEVTAGHQSAAVTSTLAQLAGRFGLRASCGSDFHHPDNGWSRIGCATVLPASCQRVWESW